MKKHDCRPRTIRLHKETIQQLAARELGAVVGGAPWSAAPGACPFTQKTCASVEFSC